MSSVPSIPPWAPPVLAPTPRPTRRRALLAGAGVAMFAAVALVATGTLQLPRAPAAANAPSAELAVARALALAVAKARAHADVPLSQPGTERPQPNRIADASRAVDLFATRSWYVQPPPPPPAVALPPAPPTAPALPYTYLGSFAPQGDNPVFFLSRGDRLIDARVGDHLDGVYELTSAAGNELVFTYLPLNIQQSLSSGAKP
jgi:hypothetical protein